MAFKKLKNKFFAVTLTAALSQAIILPTINIYAQPGETGDGAFAADEITQVQNEQDDFSSMQSDSPKRSGSSEFNITGITLDKYEVKPGDVVNVTATTDVDSNTLYKAFYFDLRIKYKDLDKEEYGDWISLEINNQGILTGSFTVNEFWANGSYDIIYYWRDDSYKQYEEIMSSFKVIGGRDDIAGPVVDSISFDKMDAKPGDIVKVSAKAHDPAGVTYLKIKLNNPGVSDSDSDNYNYHPRFYYLLPDGNGNFTAEIHIDDGWQNGVWTVEYVSAEDGLVNVSGNSEIAKNIRLNISGSKSDVSAPVVRSVTFDKTEIKNGDKFKIFVEAEDISDIDYVVIKLHNEDAPDMPLHVAYCFTGEDEEETWQFENGRWTLECEAGSGKWFHTNGLHKINYIEIHDIYGNYVSVYNPMGGEVVITKILLIMMKDLAI